MSPDNEKIRVAVIDDHAMVREALAAVLEDDDGIEIVAQGGGGFEALDIVEQRTPDVLVLDYNLPDKSALDVLDELKRRRAKVPVLVLTVHENVHYAVRAFESGARGFVIKASAVDELLGAIRTVHAGELYVTPKLSSGVLDQLRQTKKERTGLGALSTREFELLRLLGSGLGLKEAAVRLKIGISTASTYRARILQKLRLESTADLIRFALEHGLVD